jgi:hypothetical protein
MSLITDIQTLVPALYPDATFVLSSEFLKDYNAWLTEENIPLIILDNEQPKTVYIKKNNNVQKDTKIQISFLDYDNNDNTDQESENVRASMELMADRVAVNIFQAIEVRPSGNQKYKITPMFKVFSSNMTGVSLEMQVNYNEVVNFTKP